MHKGLFSGTYHGQTDGQKAKLTEFFTKQPHHMKSYESSELPEDWKQANVCPIFKKGSKTNPANYRSISLTSVTCKIMERLIRDIMMKHLLDNNLISEHQHGFVKFKSCIT